MPGVKEVRGRKSGVVEEAKVPSRLSTGIWPRSAPAFVQQGTGSPVHSCSRGFKKLPGDPMLHRAIPLYGCIDKGTGWKLRGVLRPKP